MKVIGIGDNVCDKYVNSMTMYPGGQALNFSVYSKMLGADAAYMGVFGNDDVAAHVIRTLDELEVDRSRCRQYHGENGYACINIVDGDRIFLRSNRGGVAGEKPLILDREDLDYLSSFKLIHTSNNGHFDTQLPLLKGLDARVSYDFSARMWRSIEATSKVAPFIDYAFLSAGDASRQELMEAIERLLTSGCRLVTATLGAEGAMVSDGKCLYSSTPERVLAVDTLGAGDSFATAFLLHIIEHGEAPSEIEEAMRKGALFAAKTCMVNGAFAHGIPFVNKEGAIC